MPKTSLQRGATDGLNLRLSVACNTSVPFMLFGMVLGQVSSSTLTALLLCAVGLVGYSFVEYAFHRGILHGTVTAGHHLHHVEPFAAHAMPFSTGLCGHTVMLVLLSFNIGLDFALCITLGSAAGYALFCQLHDLIHQDPILARRLMPRLYRHHMLHHREGSALSGEAHNFGVLTTFWDRLFGTYRP